MRDSNFWIPFVSGFFVEFLVHAARAEPRDDVMILSSDDLQNLLWKKIHQAYLSNKKDNSFSSIFILSRCSNLVELNHNTKWRGGAVAQPTMKW